MNETDTVDGYACPIDPMAEDSPLNCSACQ
jgi:hypothetical protein